TLSLAALEPLLASGLPANVERHLRALWGHQLRLLKQVNELLELAQLDGRVAARFRLEDAGALVRACVEAARAGAENAGIALDLDVPPRAVPLYLDRPKLETLLLSLLGSAVRHAPRGRRVQVAVVEDEAEVRVRVLAPVSPDASQGGVGLTREL